MNVYSDQISTRHSLPVEWEEISVETDDLLSHRVEGIRRMNDIVETGDVFNLDLQWDPIIPIKNTATYQVHTLFRNQYLSFEDYLFPNNL